MITTSEVRTAAGHFVLRSVYEGEITAEEARRFGEKTRPGAPYHLHGHLVLGTMLEIPNDVRKIFQAERPPDPKNPPPVALVIPSALVRMAVSLVMRASGNPNTDFFKDEASAMRFLDVAMGEFERKRK